MLTDDGFDRWAPEYDQSVRQCEQAGEYPFAGYGEVLRKIRCAVRQKGGAPRVLDIGFGTGVLTEKLYADGCAVYGLDFSRRMVDIARRKMPRARLFCGDFSKEFPPELTGMSFDWIVSTYAFHHLTDDGKVELIRRLLDQLAPGGGILIGDVAFSTRAEREACRRQSGDRWDADEIYLVWEELAARLPAGRCEFEKVSPCAGIIRIV